MNQHDRLKYDPYQYECSGDSETTTDQVYLRHIRMELQQVTTVLRELVQAIKIQTVVQAAGDDARWAHVPASWVQYEVADWIQPAITPTEGEEEEPDIDDEPPPDYGPPGSGAVITEWP